MQKAESLCRAVPCRAVMDEDVLTLEQQYLLRRIYSEAQEMDREELIAALCNSWLARFQMKAIFHEFCRDHDIGFRLEECSQSPVEMSRDELVDVFGYRPSEQEAEEYFRRAHETATMELDMDEIVCTPDDWNG